MGFFSHEKWDLLEKCTLTQLRKMAKEKGVKVESQGFFRSTIVKEDYIQCLNDSSKVSKVYIKRILRGEEPAGVSRVRVGKRMSLDTVANTVKRE